MKKSKLLKKSAFVYIVACFCCLLWGSAFPAIKIGYELFDISSNSWSSQILFAGLRFTLAGVLVISFGSIISKKLLLPEKSSVGKIAVLSVFQTILQYIFFYVGLANTTGTKGAVLNSTGVFFAVIFSVLIFKGDKLTASKLIGCVLGFAGSIIVNLGGGGLGGGFKLNGEGFIIICSISYALSTVFIKKYSESESPVMLSGYQFVLGGAVMIIFGFAMGGRLNKTSLQGIILLIYLAIVSSLAYTLWGILLKHNDVSRVATFGFMTPVFGCLLSGIFLREMMFDNAVKIVISLVLISVGIILVNKSFKKGKLL